jgi:hypothetical protein
MLASTAVSRFIHSALTDVVGWNPGIHFLARPTAARLDIDTCPEKSLLR